ncbi:FAD:protein FMN transferase [Roseivirga pacifica]|uniref:FAD:protein FMN transferase n=1 Tax=Roseivirga pacifica TaxID=1267423 RepID=UPI00227A009E|nr:FAD:protein FMN transferase [Roseivirga pacifica]
MENTSAFEHQAMATYFKLTIYNEAAEYAENAAQQAFNLIDELEDKLSRFRPDSDISRINKLKKDEHLPIDFETWEALKMAIACHTESHGTFDVGVAEHMKIFRAGKEGILNEYETHKALEKAQAMKTQASIYVDPEQPRVYCVNPGMYFDLGGIGKGYALDKVDELMQELEIKTFTFSAGDSTLMIKNDVSVKPYFTYQITAKLDKHRLDLGNISVSASGTFHQGSHIFDPRTGQNDFKPNFERVWVAAKNATYSDAFSTACFILSLPEIEEIVQTNEQIEWVAYAIDGKLTILRKNQLS